MRVLVTGAGGQLGAELLPALRRADHQAAGVDHRACDVTDPDAVARRLDEALPDAVVNCAAWTDVDGAESHERDAARVNAHGPGVVAAACAERGIRLLHISTDYVFDGMASAPIPEDAPTHPLSVYGRTKLDGEEAVRRVLPGALIVRTAWLYGGTGPNFVLRILDAGREKGEVRVIDDQFGSPTWTGHLAPALVRLLALGAEGTFHIAGTGVASRLEQAVAALEAAGLSGVTVTPARTADFPARARRPAYSALECRAWLALGEPPLPDWRVGVRAYVAELRAGGRLTD